MADESVAYKEMICTVRCGWKGMRGMCDIIDTDNPKQFDPACPKCGAACEPKQNNSQQRG